MKLFPIFILFVFSIFTISVQARDYYIVFDESCMDRLEYSFTGSTNEGNYISYQIDISQTERAVLEIGQESAVTQSYVPTNFMRCDNVNFTLDRIQEITTNGDQIFLVRRITSRKYSVSKVKFASYYKFDGNVIQYFSPKYRFEFDLETGVIGENIAFETPRSEVYFEGRLDNDCTGAFIFRQYSEQFNKPAHTDIIFIPEVGVVEERSGRNVEDAFNNSLHLEKVNGLDQNLHLQVVCGKLDPNDIPTPNEEIVMNPEGEMVDKGDGIEGNTRGEHQSNNSDYRDFHVVQRGETLFSIARNNDITLDQLLNWNKLTKASTIFPGDQLRISPSVAPTRFTQRGGDSNPAPYDVVVWDDARSKSSETTLPADYDSMMEGFHIVKPGETMASLALTYGFTEAKFREINGIAMNRVPRIGQKLRTSECNCPDNSSDQNIIDPRQSESPYSYFQENSNPSEYSSSFNTRIQNKERFDRETPINKNIPTFYDSQVRTQQQPYYETTTPEDGRPSYYDFRAPNTRKVHTVADGESIYSIARKYNLKVEDIRSWNGMEKNEIVIPFQRLYVEK